MTCWTMNTPHLTSPESSSDNSNDVMTVTLVVNEDENINAPLTASDVNVSKERATAVLSPRLSRSECK